MRSSVHDLLPPGLRRSLSKFGKDLARARRKRHLTAAMMAERIGVAKSTYARIEKGDPAVAMGAYAMALFVLGFGEALGDLVVAYFRIPLARAKEILGEIERAVSGWRDRGKALGMTDCELEKFADAFEHPERKAVRPAIS